MNCIILAGGLGQRLRPALSTIPKSLAPIAGKPFLTYLLQYWKTQGVKHFTLATGYKSDDIEKYVLDNGFKNFVDISREDQSLGTGGALLNACHQLQPKEPFLLVNGDTFFPVPLKRLIEVYSQNNASVLISINQKENSSGRYTGIEFDTNNKVLLIQKTANPQTWVSCGTYLVSPQILSQWEHWVPPLNFETDILAPLCINKNHKVFALPETETSFIDIGTPEDYNKAQKLIPEVIQ